MSTYFSGSFTVDPPIAPEHFAYLRAFARSRRMRRDPARLGPDPVRERVGLPPGEDGGYYVGGREDASVLDSSYAPKGQPSLWCPWTVGDEGDVRWDGMEKAGAFVSWIEYIVEHFLNPWGYRLGGKVKFIDDDAAGVLFAVEGKIVVKTLDDLAL